MPVKKVEQKIEVKNETNIKKEEQKERAPEVNEDEVINNAQYLASFGFDFEKCYQWSRTYPLLSRENLL
jgi:hypothetical protein